MRKNGSIDFRLNRTSVGDEYGAGPPEKEFGSYRGVLRRSGKRDFSPYLNRGLGESHSEYCTRVREYVVREYARKVCGPCLVDTKAGNIVLQAWQRVFVVCGDELCSNNMPGYCMYCTML